PHGGADTLFARYGGFAKIRSIVMDFYERVLDNDLVGGHFDGIDMVRLIDHQTKFIAALTGGPADISDERLARAHRHLHVRHDEFDELVTLLSATLEAAGFTPADRAKVLGAIEARRSLIVDEGGGV
ncbi:MAG: group 1 truncated hemoglobin, partial [Pseudomonadota bacterium]